MEVALLASPIGCGKTAIMNLIRPFADNHSDCKIKTIFSEYLSNLLKMVLTPSTNTPLSKLLIPPFRLLFR
jgi:hypothetical protein